MAYYSMFTKEELKTLQGKCDGYLRGNRAEFKKVNSLYRNKDEEYFDDILNLHGGIMERRLKDQGGDPRCPINERLRGVFFSATLDDWHRDDPNALPDISPFGRKRLIIPVGRLINAEKRLYFADFYCMTGSGYHSVMLVVTEPGSDADKFCSKHLLKLDLNTNKYLRENSGIVWVCHYRYLFVEVFYTKDIKIGEEEKHGAHFSYVSRVIGTGSSKPDGVPKKHDCTICNI